MTRWRAATVFILSLCAIASGDSVATAQQSPLMDLALSRMAGTLNVASVPVWTSGNLTGCSLSFDALHQDWKYRAGAFIKVSGSVGFLESHGQIGADLKVVVLEIDPTQPSLGKVPSPPSRIFLIGSDLKTNLETHVQSFPSDPGALFSVFQLSPTFEMVMAGIDENRLTIAFNSFDGDSDIQLPIELDVVRFAPDGTRERSGEAKRDFLGCLDALVGAAVAE
jgi:hypothetical protein